MLDKIQQNYHVSKLRSQSNCSDLILALSSKADLCNELAGILNKYRHEFDRVVHGQLVVQILKLLGIVMLNRTSGVSVAEGQHEKFDVGHMASDSIGVYGGYKGSDRLINKPFNTVFTELALFGAEVFQKLPASTETKNLQHRFNQYLRECDKVNSFQQQEINLRYLLQSVVDQVLDCDIYGDLDIDLRQGIIGLITHGGSFDSSNTQQTDKESINDKVIKNPTKSD